MTVSTTVNLIRDLGIEEVKNLKLLSFLHGNDSTLFYLEQAAKYRLKFNQLLKESEYFKKLKIKKL